MSFDPLSLVMSGIVGSAGFVALAYGKSQKRPPQIITGLALMVFPYFVPNPWATLAIGAVLLGLMWAATKAGY